MPAAQRRDSTGEVLLAGCSRVERTPPLVGYQRGFRVSGQLTAGAGSARVLVVGRMHVTSPSENVPATGVAAAGTWPGQGWLTWQLKCSR